MACSLLNLIVVMALPDLFFRFHRLLRPLAVITQYRNVQKIVGNIFTTVPAVAKVTVLLILHVAFCGVLAFVMFKGARYDLDHYDNSLWSNGAITTVLCDYHDANGTVISHSETYVPPCSPFYPKGCSDYFGNLWGGMHQLFVLLTTANYPDVRATCRRADAAAHVS